MPISPVAAAILTWVTSAEVKIAWILLQRPLTRNRRFEKVDPNLVRKNERQLYLVRDLRISTASQRDRFGARRAAEARNRKADIIGSGG